MQVSRLGVISKGKSGKWHLILDLSSAKGFIVNDCFNANWCSLSYVTVVIKVSKMDPYRQGVFGVTNTMLCMVARGNSAGPLFMRQNGKYNYDKRFLLLQQLERH